MTVDSRSRKEALYSNMDRNPEPTIRWQSEAYRAESSAVASTDIAGVKPYMRQKYDTHAKDTGALKW